MRIVATFGAFDLPAEDADHRRVDGHQPLASTEHPIAQPGDDSLQPQIMRPAHPGQPPAEGGRVRNLIPVEERPQCVVLQSAVR